MHLISILKLPVMLNMYAAEGWITEDQHHRATEYLQTARAQLQSAEANKGGNRAEAIRDVDEAIGAFDAALALWRRRKAAA